MTSERLAAEREATLAGFAAALAAAGEMSDMLTTAARQIAVALHATQATIALWSGSSTPAVTGWPPAQPDREPTTAVTGALAAARRQPAASVTVLPDEDGACLLAAPLDGAGTSAVVAGFPAARTVRAEERDLFAILTSHLAQVLAKARDYAQARAVALTLQQAILGPTQLPHGFAVRYAPAVAPLEVGGDWYDVVPVPGERVGVLVGDCVGRGHPRPRNPLHARPDGRGHRQHHRARHHRDHESHRGPAEPWRASSRCRGPLCRDISRQSCAVAVAAAVQSMRPQWKPHLP